MSDKHSSSGHAKKPELYKIPADHSWSKLWMIFAGLAVVGAGISAAGFAADAKRFAFSYTTAFAWGVTIALGGLFFVCLQHLVRANWSLVVRRGAEHVMAALPVFFILFLPIAFVFGHTLYPWMGEHVSEVVEAKKGYLNFGFWVGRALFYFAVWIGLTAAFYTWSKKNDETGDVGFLVKARTLSHPGILLFALTLTFAGIDWFMSLDPEWFSTMFGVYIFAGSTISIMALLNILFFGMNSAGLLKNGEITNEHHHDLGKLQFAFTIFWAYISFSQYMLIWYANIPEETIFFHHRQDHGWGTVSVFIILGHFFVPFFMTLSREAKRQFTFVLKFAAFWILFMHYVDLYWLVMPNFKDAHGHSEFAPHWMDLGPLLLVVGALFAVVFKSMVSSNLVPAKDPRIERALSFENA